VLAGAILDHQAAAVETIARLSQRLQALEGE
jgi:hypothetical protein